MRVPRELLRAGGSSRRRRDPAAFARLDLLAVIVAAGLVALVSFPSLGRTQVRSGVIGCVANQRQLLQAFLLYAAENQDGLVSTAWTTTSNARVELASGGFWPGPTQAIVPGLSPAAALTSVRDGLARGPLWNYAPDAEVYHCPADRRWQVLRPGTGWGWDSYTKTDGMGSGIAANVRAYRRVPEVTDPSMSAVFIEEADPRGSNLGSWSLGVTPPSWTDVPAANHEDGAVVGLIDGHTELRRWTEASTLKAARGAMLGKSSFFFPGAGPKNPDFAWIWNRYRHLGWKPLP